MNNKIIIQVSIDTQTIQEGVRQARIASDSGCDWIEVGTPLVTYEGMAAINAIVSEAKNHQQVLVDYKALDGVAQYFFEAGKRGASIATVMAQATDFSIMSAVEAGKKANVKVMADMFCWPEETYEKRALRMQELGVDCLLVHLSIDEFRHPQGSKNPLMYLAAIAPQVTIPIGVVVFTIDEALRAIDAGASILVVGTPIIESANAQKELTQFIADVRKHAP